MNQIQTYEANEFSAHTAGGDAELNDKFGLRSGWEFFRHELLYITWALMEVALITPVILAFAPWSQFWPPFLVAAWLLLVILLPFNISRVSSVFGIPVERQQIIMVVALVASLFISWRTLLFTSENLFDFAWLGQFIAQLGQSGDPGWSRILTIFLIMLVAWWRGLSLVGRPVEIGQIGFRLRIGILLLVVFVAGIAGSQLIWSVTPFILLYYFAALLAVVLTRVEQLEMGYSGISFPLGPQWLAFVAFAAGLVAFLTGIISGAISGQGIINVIGVFSPLWLGLRFLGITVAMTVAYLLSPLLIALAWLMDLLISIFQPIVEQVGLEELQLQNPPTLEGLEAEEITTIDPPFFELPQQLLPALVMIFLILLVTLVLGRLLRLMRKSATLETESISPLANLERPSLAGRGRNLLNQLGLFKRWRTAATVRQIYRQMSRMAAEAGFARAESETPYEYLPILFEAWPDHKFEIRVITDAYTRVHYGEIPETAEELDQLRSAWSKIRDTEPKSESGQETEILTKKRSRR